MSVRGAGSWDFVKVGRVLAEHDSLWFDSFVESFPHQKKQLVTPNDKPANQIIVLMMHHSDLSLLSSSWFLPLLSSISSHLTSLPLLSQLPTNHLLCPLPPPEVNNDPNDSDIWIKIKAPSLYNIGWWSWHFKYRYMLWPVLRCLSHVSATVTQAEQTLHP